MHTGHLEVPTTARPRRPGSVRREWHGVAAMAFVAASLSFAVFVALYRAPVPADAFSALGEQIATSVICLANL